MAPEETESRLLYRDGLMLVIDKPAGLAVHRGPKGGASVEDYFDGLRFGLTPEIDAGEGVALAKVAAGVEQGWCWGHRRPSRTRRHRRAAGDGA